MSQVPENKRLGHALLDTIVEASKTAYRTMIPCREGPRHFSVSADEPVRAAARVYFAREFPYHRPASRNFLSDAAPLRVPMHDA